MTVKTSGGRPAPARAVALQAGPFPLGDAFGSDGLIALDRMAERFAMSMGQLADTMGLSREAVHRSARANARKTQARAMEMLEIVTRVRDWAGGERQALAWYRAEPIAAFGGRTAESLVKDGHAASVRDYLDHIATGGFA